MTRQQLDEVLEVLESRADGTFAEKMRAIEDWSRENRTLALRIRDVLACQPGKR